MEKQYDISQLADSSSAYGKPLKIRVRKAFATVFVPLHILGDSIFLTVLEETIVRHESEPRIRIGALLNPLLPEAEGNVESANPAETIRQVLSLAAPTTPRSSHFFARILFIPTFVRVEVFESAIQSLIA